MLKHNNDKTILNCVDLRRSWFKDALNHILKQADCTTKFHLNEIIHMMKKAYVPKGLHP